VFLFPYEIKNCDTYFLMLILVDSRGKKVNARVSLDPDPAAFWYLN